MHISKHLVITDCSYSNPCSVRTNLICIRKDDFPKYAQLYHYTSLKYTSVFMLSKIKFSLIDIY